MKKTPTTIVRNQIINKMLPKLQDWDIEWVSLKARQNFRGRPGTCSSTGIRPQAHGEMRTADNSRRSISPFYVSNSTKLNGLWNTLIQSSTIFVMIVGKGLNKILFGILSIYTEKIFLFRCSEFDFFDFYKRGCSAGESNKLKSRIFRIIRYCI